MSNLNNDKIQEAITLLQEVIKSQEVEIFQKALALLNDAEVDHEVDIQPKSDSISVSAQSVGTERDRVIWYYHKENNNVVIATDFLKIKETNPNCKIIKVKVNQSDIWNKHRNIATKGLSDDDIKAIAFSDDGKDTIIKECGKKIFSCNIENSSINSEKLQPGDSTVLLFPFVHYFCAGGYEFNGRDSFGDNPFKYLLERESKSPIRLFKDNKKFSDAMDMAELIEFLPPFGSIDDAARDRLEQDNSKKRSFIKHFLTHKDEVIAELKEQGIEIWNEKVTEEQIITVAESVYDYIEEVCKVYNICKYATLTEHEKAKVESLDDNELMEKLSVLRKLESDMNDSAVLSMLEDIDDVFKYFNKLSNRQESTNYFNKIRKQFDVKYQLIDQSYVDKQTPNATKILNQSYINIIEIKRSDIDMKDYLTITKVGAFYSGESEAIEGYKADAVQYRYLYTPIDEATDEQDGYIRVAEELNELSVTRLSCFTLRDKEIFVDRHRDALSLFTSDEGELTEFQQDLKTALERFGLKRVTVPRRLTDKHLNEGYLIAEEGNIITTDPVMGRVVIREINPGFSIECGTGEKLQRKIIVKPEYNIYVVM